MQKTHLALRLRRFILLVQVCAYNRKPQAEPRHHAWFSLELCQAHNFTQESSPADDSRPVVWQWCMLYALMSHPFKQGLTEEGRCLCS
jgi:hypothetical protein